VNRNHVKEGYIISQLSTMKWTIQSSHGWPTCSPIT